LTGQYVADQPVAEQLQALLKRAEAATNAGDTPSAQAAMNAYLKRVGGSAASIFNSIGCQTCHTPTLITAPPHIGNADADTLTALGKIIFPR
jgi:hypothetical protein